MELEELLSVMDRVAANLVKLDGIWQRAIPFIPTGPARGSHPDYDDLCRAWSDVLAGLPKIDGWTITEPLPDIDGLGQSFIDYLETGEPPFPAYEAGQKPGNDLAEYRYRLNRARRRAIRDRLQHLSTLIDTTLPILLTDVARDSQEPLTDPQTRQIAGAVDEIERLLADTTPRHGRWADLHRHLHFGQGHDWHDIAELDWPSVRTDINTAAHADTDPIEVPHIDLGTSAAGQLTGTATTALPWERLTDDGFERLLYDLLRGIPEHANVQWLTHTRAADRGRDLSLDRVLRDGTGGIRTERVIVQAKHWLTQSVRPTHIADTLTAIKLWEPPVIRGLIIATTGRFTTDAVAWAERHNNSGTPPLIDLWPDNKLETLITQQPHLAAAHGLR